jgi:hypothetical protein
MELTCYIYEGWRTRMRPADSKRAWMDQSVDRFAYRCLPLAIANAHGWEILAPCGFEARWNGGPAKEAVEIRYDPGADPLTAPVSLFGQATLTFHTGGLFRTPPGWNLWVTGPPNEAKDGIAPLSGVVETDWSPYTFTMNWRFTRPGHWVRFEENEPIAFLFPVPRDAIEAFEPRIRSIREEPEVEAQYLKWTRDRVALAERMRDAKPAAPADQWQKSYYRGVDAYDRPGPDDHRTKLRVKPFADAAGQVVAMPEARRCPAQAPAPAPPPPPSASRFSLGAPVLGGFAPPKKPGG